MCLNFNSIKNGGPNLIQIQVSHHSGKKRKLSNLRNLQKVIIYSSSYQA